MSTQCTEAARHPFSTCGRQSPQLSPVACAWRCAEPARPLREGSVSVGSVLLCRWENHGTHLLRGCLKGASRPIHPCPDTSSQVTGIKHGLLLSHSPAPRQQQLPDAARHKPCVPTAYRGRLQPAAPTSVMRAPMLPPVWGLMGLWHTPNHPIQHVLQRPQPARTTILQGYPTPRCPLWGMSPPD